MSAERQEKKGRFVMTMSTIVTDEQLGKYFRKMTAIRDRLGKSLPFEKVMHALQEIHDGEFSTIINIDRLTHSDDFMLPFNWGPCKVAEQDERSLTIKLLDLTEVHLENALHENEHEIIGAEQVDRLKNSGHILLDGKILMALLHKTNRIPDSWKEHHQSARYIYFDGTYFWLDNELHTLCMYWDQADWQCIPVPITTPRASDNVSAVLSISRQ